MEPIIEQLNLWGCDTSCVQTRFRGDLEFYLHLLEITAKDPNYEKLASALEVKDNKAAFESAHALKGMVGNMGLTPLYQPACEIVERLRSGEDADVSVPFARLAEAYQQFFTLLHEYTR